jgi:hypothetical protein
LSKHSREFLSNEICHHLFPGQVVDVYIKEEEQCTYKDAGILHLLKYMKDIDNEAD